MDYIVPALLIACAIGIVKLMLAQRESDKAVKRRLKQLEEIETMSYRE